MTTNNIMNTSTVCLSDIIGNGKTYTVPMYQRDYSWEEEHWEDLWSDILAIEQTENVHYLGSIVLQDMGNKHFTIIDGQQRLATLTLIVLSIIKLLKDVIDQHIDIENNNERIKLLQKKFIGDKDPASLTYSAKLQLNENNDSFFQSNLLIFRTPRNIHTLNDADKRIWQAYNFFVEKVATHFKDQQDGAIITSFLDAFIAEKLLFIQIIVKDELSAYTVFETLNSRGVGLTVTDLLKNYLFSIVSEVDLRHVREKWKKIIDIIGLKKFPVFLRHYWISKNQLIRQEQLFRAIRNSIKTSKDVIFVLDELADNALLYNALSHYADDFWSGNKQQRKYINELSLFKETQAYPILMAAYNNLSEKEFITLLKCIAVIIFRYSVIARYNPNIKETFYNKAAVQISNKKISNAKEIIDILKPLYLTDKDFKNIFSTKSISTKRGKKLVRYILYSIENYVSQRDYDFEDNPGTIEHILPENDYQNYIDDFPQSIHENFVYRLGNYTLLEVEKNRQCETSPFDEKKAIYQTSQYETAKQVLANDWTPNTLELRQEKLAKYATAIWRISQFD